MRVLLVSQYFTPEITAAAGRMHGFAAGLVRRGHEVEVVCEVPSHPEGVVAPEYGGHFSERRSVDGFEVTYVWVRATPSKATRARLINYGSFAVTATVAGSARRRLDAIVASSPPLPVGNVAAALALRHRAPWVLDVRDLWPDIAVVLGQLPEGRRWSSPAAWSAASTEARLAITADRALQGAHRGRGGEGKVTR